ncbi:FUSC family protein [Gluconobacter morbifer]|nr:FUSC family protein [Gluconobacter morbifer]
MSTADIRRHFVPPAFDQGDPPSGLRALWHEMKSVPGRGKNTARLVIITLLCTVIGEVFRVPFIAVFPWIAFLLAGNDQGTTLAVAPMGTVMLVIGIGVTILIFMVSLSQPAVRLPLMVLMAFAAGFLGQATTLGPFLNILCFWVFFNVTLGDSAIGLALTTPVFIGDTTDSLVPDLLLMPPEEALVRITLWVGLLFVIAVTVLVLGDRLMGRDPALAVREGLSSRLLACSAFCAGKPDAYRALFMQAQAGAGGLTRLHALSVKVHGMAPYHAAGRALIRDVSQLGLLLLAWRRIMPRTPETEPYLARMAAFCEAAAAAIRENRPVNGLTDTMPDGQADAPGVEPLTRELHRVLTLIAMVLARPDQPDPAILPEVVSRPRSLFKADAFTNPAYVRYALRLTLAVCICYAVERLTDWEGIHTAILTCFVVSLETLGDTLHKMVLRICGCLLGAAAGIGSILLLMPYLTDIGDLLLLLLPVVTLGAWIKSGSLRISYAGTQLVLAFFMCVLQNYGPTLNMEAGRNRVVGMLLANVVLFMCNALIWPRSVGSIARRQMTVAADRLADLAVHESPAGSLVDHTRERLLGAFSAASGAARGALVNDILEPGKAQHHAGQPLDSDLVTRLQFLSVPILMTASLPFGTRTDDRVRTVFHHYQTEVANWLRQFGHWIATGEDRLGLWATLPMIPSVMTDGMSSEDKGLCTSLAVWSRVFSEEARDLLRSVLPLAPEDAVPPYPEESHAHA